MKTLATTLTSLLGLFVFGQEVVYYDIFPTPPIDASETVTISVPADQMPSGWNDIYLWAWTNINGADVNSAGNGEWTDSDPANQLVYNQASNSYTISFRLDGMFPDVSTTDILKFYFIFKPDDGHAQSQTYNFTVTSSGVSYTVQPDPVTDPNNPVTVTLTEIPSYWDLSEGIGFWSWADGNGGEEGCAQCSGDIQLGTATYPKMTDNGDGTYSITFTPNEFFNGGDVTQSIGFIFFPVTNTYVQGQFVQSSDYSALVDQNLAGTKENAFRSVALQTLQNPVSQGILKVRTNGAGMLYLYDMNGKIVKTFKAVNGDQTFGVGGLPAGMYLLQLKTGKDVSVVKILVK